MTQLRDYQLRGVEGVRAAWREGDKRVLVYLATGGGKTLLSCEGLLRPAVDKGKVVWFVAPRTSLVNQTSRKLSEIGIRHGVIMADHPLTDYRRQVQVCSKDTITRRMEKIKIPPPDMIVHDECHRCSDRNGSAAFFEQYPDAYHVGLTATPGRLDGRGLGRLFQRMVRVATPSELISLGWLRPFVQHSVPIDLDDLPQNSGDYTANPAAEKMCREGVLAAALTQWKRLAEGRPTIGFTPTKESAAKYMQLFRDAGIAAGCITEDTNENDRQAIFRDIEAGRCKVVFSVEALAEGFDLPCISAFIGARPTMWFGRYVQMVGRCLRPSKSSGCVPGEHAVVIDLAGLYQRHGLVSDDYPWTLADTRGEPAKATPTMKECPACGVWNLKAAERCTCGELFAPEVGEQGSLFGDGLAVDHRDVTLVQVGAGMERTPFVLPTAPLLDRIVDVLNRSRDYMSLQQLMAATGASEREVLHELGTRKPDCPIVPDKLGAESEPRWWTKQQAAAHKTQNDRRTSYREIQESAFLAGEEARVVGMRFRHLYGELPKSADREGAEDRIRFIAGNCMWKHEVGEHMKARNRARKRGVA